MIEPPKATKGRRMSKKSRKKSPKSAPPGKARAKTAAKAETSLRKTAQSSARKSAKKTSSEASHRPASKTLKAAKTGAKARTAASTKGKTVTKKTAETESKTGSSRQLAEGAKAPAFRLPRDGGEVVSLSDFSGQKLVLFFYPRANTPGCTKEAIDFTRLSGAFAASGTAVLGISADSQKAQESFRNKHKLDVPLISDEKHEMLEAYGAWGEKSLYGRVFLGIIRTTVLIGADGLVKRIWRHVKVDGHADAVLEAARSI
jgi:thioredoxin-dependent peroxiredoxin